MIARLLLLIACVLAGGLASGQTGDPVIGPPVVRVELPAAAHSTGLEIAVGDIATVTCADDALATRVRAASLGYAPAPGFSRTLRGDLVSSALRQAMPSVRVRVVGADRCRVTPKVTTIKGTALRAEAAVAMRAAIASLDAEARPAGDVPDLQLPAGEGEPRLVARASRGELFPGKRNVAVEVWIGERLYRTVQIPFELAVWERTAVLRRAINPREPLHAGLFEVKRVPLRDSRSTQALGLDQLAGAIAMKAMPAGAILTEHDVHREVVIRRGDQVTVTVINGAVRVTDVGVAKADGRMGERLRVELRSSGKELIAVVKGGRQVEVIIQ